MHRGPVDRRSCVVCSCHCRQTREPSLAQVLQTMVAMQEHTMSRLAAATLEISKVAMAIASNARNNAQNGRGTNT